MAPRGCRLTYHVSPWTSLRMTLVMNNAMSIGHRRIHFSLVIKASLSAESVVNVSFQSYGK